MKAMDKRLAVLEDKAGLGSLDGMTITLAWYCSEVTGASCGGMFWQRSECESLAVFEARVKAEAPHPEGKNFRLIRLTGAPGGFGDDIL